jgi:hypothetical protein
VNDNVGHITGTVGDISRVDVNCSPDTDYAVYAFSGADVIADDDDGNDPDPVSTALVEPSSPFDYTLGFLDAGVYTLAFTCQAVADNVDENNDEIKFIGSSNVIVSAGTTITHDFN